MSRHKLLQPWRYFRRFALYGLQFGDPFLQLVERAMVRHQLARGSAFAPIFIIGPPRSGSTLLYKVMVDRWRLASINNFSAYFFRTLCFGTWLGQCLGFGRQPSGYEIKYGKLKGWGSPSEAGMFWYRWFPGGQQVYVAPGMTKPDALEKLRSEVYAASAVCNAPMLFKNLYNSMRIAPLVEAFPTASFIICERDPLQNALSLLRGRIENLGDEQQWFSLPPREVEALKELPYAAQVAGQVHCIRSQIGSDVRAYGCERFIEVSYEEFCQDVHATLERVEAFLTARGHTIIRRETQIPRRFEIRRVSGIGKGDYEAVRAALTDFKKAD